MASETKCRKCGEVIVKYSDPDPLNPFSPGSVTTMTCKCVKNYVKRLKNGEKPVIQFWGEGISRGERKLQVISENDFISFILDGDILAHWGEEIARFDVISLLQELRDKGVLSVKVNHQIR